MDPNFCSRLALINEWLLMAEGGEDDLDTETPFVGQPSVVTGEWTSLCPVDRSFGMPPAKRPPRLMGWPEDVDVPCLLSPLLEVLLLIPLNEKDLKINFIFDYV